ncbi:hypothetical protein [Streptomyces sp. NPDC056883]|uniref:hypothetical protein n=1 Tax=Streptomyces sp. NPDC056883 TaxID=3345959 RepID=UPI00369087F6
MKADNIRGFTYLALAIGAILTFWIPSQVLVEIGGQSTDAVFAAFLAAAGALMAWGAFRRKPLLEYTAAPLGITAFIVYAVCSFWLGKYGMGLVVSAHAGWFLARYMTLRRELEDFKKEKRGCRQ